MTPSLISEEVCHAIAIMQDDLFQRLEADGFAVDGTLDVDIRQTRPNKRFKLGHVLISCQKCNFSKRKAGSWFYEQLLMSNVHGELGCDTEDLSVHYHGNDVVEGIDISLTVVCYVNHPEEYKQALRDSVAIRTAPPGEQHEFIQCGI